MKKKDLFKNAKVISKSEQSTLRGGSVSGDNGDSYFNDNGDSIHSDNGDSIHSDNMQ